MLPLKPSPKLLGLGFISPLLQTPQLYLGFSVPKPVLTYLLISTHPPCWLKSGSDKLLLAG